jgi:hypothetical protein
MTWREQVVALIGGRAEDWRQCALAMLAIPPEDGPQMAPGDAAGVALRTARHELLGREQRAKAARKGRVPEWGVTEESRYDRPADSQYEITERYIHDTVIRECRVALVWLFGHLDEAQVDDALDTLMPLVTRKVKKGFLPAASAPSHQRALVTDTVQRVSQRLLTELGTKKGPKQKRGMTTGRGIPTSGPASKPIIWADPAGGRSWVVEEDHYRQVNPVLAALTLADTDTLAPHRNGTERTEQGDDRIEDFRRPVRKASTRKNRRSGRMGGSAIVR